MVILLMAISCYFINLLLVVILLIVIDGYSIGGCWWLLMVIILVVIDGYSIVDIGGY
jgi:hypothetical protein